MNDHLNVDAATKHAPSWLSRMKVHLRHVPIRGTTYHVITLRPGLDVKFSTNFYHGTWHILSDGFGSEILGRLMWGLAFQKQPNTLVLIELPHLQLSPFDGAPSWPVVLTVQENCPLRAKDMRELKARLDHLPETRTIRWQSHGLARYAIPDCWEMGYSRSEPFDDETLLSGGIICYRAKREVMKFHASVIGKMRPSTLVELADRGEAETRDFYFITWDGCATGEVQLFEDYRHMVKAATAARKRVVGQLSKRVSADELEDLVSAERRRPG
jgi:hypothetical protein